MKTTEITEININSLFEKIASVIEEARRRASTAINLSESADTLWKMSREVKKELLMESRCSSNFQRR